MQLPDIKKILQQRGITRIQEFEAAELAVDYAAQLERGGKDKIINAVRAVESGEKLKELPPYKAFYPFVAIYVGTQPADIDRSAVHGFARVENEMLGCTVAGLDFLANFYKTELALLAKSYQASIFVGLSEIEMPMPFVVQDHLLTAEQVKLFSPIDVRQIELIQEPTEDNPLLSYFSGPRIDYSLCQFEHHTGTKLADCQRYVCLVNYQMFERIFRRIAAQQCKENPDFKFVEAEVSLTGDDEDGVTRPQMPAFHWTRPDGNGVTLINIGVGPSNAKTIVDNIAVIRPHLVLMVGHCAGLRITQSPGRVIIGEAFIRNDGLMDHLFDERQQVLSQGAVIKTLKDSVAAENGKDDYHAFGEAGVVISTADRHWEIDSQLRELVMSSRALALDMESATVATTSLSYRIPFGALLIVTDIPTFGVVKLRGKAQEIYRDSVERHMRIALRAIDTLRQGGNESTQSRNLRGPLDPPML